MIVPTPLFVPLSFCPEHLSLLLWSRKCCILLDDIGFYPRDCHNTARNWQFWTPHIEPEGWISLNIYFWQKTCSTELLRCPSLVNRLLSTCCISLSAPKSDLHRSCHTTVNSFSEIYVVKSMSTNFAKHCSWICICIFFTGHCINPLAFLVIFTWLHWNVIITLICLIPVV